MKWLIVAMVALGVAAAITGRRWILWLTSGYLVLCGVWGIYDFWKWEYEYGHNLDPHAAIVVPGMAYQPPLIGFKQLLNFGAYSIPDVGGWIFLGCGVLHGAGPDQHQPARKDEHFRLEVHVFPPFLTIGGRGTQLSLGARFIPRLR